MSNPQPVLMVAESAPIADFVAALNVRSIGVDEVTYEEVSVSQRLATTNVVVFVVGAHAVGPVADWVQEYAVEVMDHGADILVCVEAADVTSARERLKRHLDDVGTTTGGIHVPRLDVVVSVPQAVATTVAHLLCHDRRTLWGLDRINGSVPSRSASLLIARAFSEPGINRIDVVDLPQGFSDARVFRLAVSEPLRSRLPFFAKLAPRSSALWEYDNFRTNVSEFVPFSARPGLLVGRCVVGGSHGLLVGQLIEECEALRARLLRTIAPVVLHRVFEELLRGWWRVRVPEANQTPVPLLNGLESWITPESAERSGNVTARWTEAAARKWAQRDPGSIRGEMAAYASTQHLRGLVHGDLHTRNIQVQGDQPFLIDFGSIREAAILADPAMLEASVVCDFTDEHRRTNGIASLDGWRKWLMNELYSPGWEKIQIARQVAGGDNAMAVRLCEALRVIRMQAMAVQKFSEEYRMLVAAAFLKLSSFSAPADDAGWLETATVMYALSSEVV